MKSKKTKSAYPIRILALFIIVFLTLWLIPANVVFASPGTKPEITILGDNPATVEVGTTYVDEGAIATDDVEGDLTEFIGVVDNVDTSVVGSYEVTYGVSDSDGNAATEVIRTVNVVDATSPEITILGDNPATVEVGSTYVDEGATATDNVDGDLTGSIETDSNVDTSIADTYEVTYSVGDNAGNATTEVRSVVVEGSVVEDPNIDETTVQEVTAYNPSINADKLDYIPGEEVTIEGLGFKPGENIRIIFHAINDSNPDGPIESIEHTGMILNIDVSGTFTYKYKILGSDRYRVEAWSLITNNDGTTEIIESNTVEFEGEPSVVVDYIIGNLLAYTNFTDCNISFTIYKFDAVHNSPNIPLSGAVFEIWYSSSTSSTQPGDASFSKLGTATTNASGIARFPSSGSYTSYGWFKIKETATPSGYKLNSGSSWQVIKGAYNSNTDGSFTYNIENNPIEIKFDKDFQGLEDDHNLPNSGYATFGLFKVGDDATAKATDTIYRDGHVEFRGNFDQPGTYYIRETHTPDGYLTMSDIINISIDALGNVTPSSLPDVDNNKEVTYPVSFGKNFDATPSVAAVFNIYAKDSGGNPTGLSLGTDSLSANGTVDFAGLLPGDYVIVETTPPEFNPMSNIIINISSNGTVTGLGTLPKVNTLKTYPVSFGKNFDATPSVAAVFNIYAKDSGGNPTGLSLGTDSLSANGTVDFAGLLPGDYVIVETTPPEFNPMSNIIINISSNGTVTGLGTLPKVNTLKTYPVSFGKNFDATPSVAAVFNIYAKDSGGNPTGLSLGTDSLSANGTVDFAGLLPGDYVIVETTPPEFNPMSNIIINISSNGTVTGLGTLPKVNTLKTYPVSFGKNFDATPSVAAVFNIYAKDSGGNPTGLSLGTDSLSANGTVDFAGLLPGDYVIVETTPPEFNPMSNIIINISSNGTVTGLGTLPKVNTLKTYPVSFGKNFDATPSVAAVFNIYAKDSGGNPTGLSLGTDSLSANGTVDFAGLLPGDYVIVETTPPEFNPMSNIIINISSNGTVTGLGTLPKVNTLKSGKIQITKTFISKSGVLPPVGGFNFTITDKNGVVTPFTIVPGNTWDSGNLPLGTYTITETDPGYLVVINVVGIPGTNTGLTPKSIVIELTYNDQLIKIGIENDPELPSSVQLTKYWPAGTAGTVEAYFQLVDSDGKIYNSNGVVDMAYKGQLVSGNSGNVVTWSNIQWGTYTVIESSKPDGYNLASITPATIVINQSNDGGIFKVDAVNTTTPPYIPPTIIIPTTITDDGGDLDVAALTNLSVLAFTGIDPIIPISGGSAVIAGIAMLIATLRRRHLTKHTLNKKDEEISKV